MAIVWQFILGLTLYFTPTIIAEIRGLPNLKGLFYVNAVTGWTGAGWLLALIFSFQKKK